MYDQAFRFLSNVDGLSLQAYAWSVDRPRAVLVLAHGLAEHAQRYDRFAQALRKAEIATYALDHRGHGASPGPSGLGDVGRGGWSALVADLAQLVDRVRGDHDEPLALFGHSMGSFAAQQYCYSRSSEIDALVLSGSTAWELPGPNARLPRFEPNREFEPARTQYDWLSRDPDEVDKYVADPWCGFETQLGRTRGSFIDWEGVNDPTGPARIRSDLPVLLVAGDEDPLNRKLEGLRMLQDRWHAAGVARIDTRYYPGGRHEMLNEINRETVTDDIVAWLGDALGPNGG